MFQESETEVKNVAFHHSIDNTTNDFSSPVSAIQSEELLHKENLSDLILLTNNIGVQNELQVRRTYGCGLFHMGSLSSN